MPLRPATRLAVPFALALAACQPAQRDEAPASPAPSGSPAADAPRERPADTVILGEATYRERIKVPPGASLTVELVSVGDAAPRVLASTRLPDVAGPPIPFSLPYDAARVPAAGRYGLRATLDGPDGERWFATPEPVPVVPGEGLAVEVLLRRATSQAVTSQASAGSTHHWECGDLGVMSRYGASDVRLSANARTWTLPLARSASGARYADASGNEFWTKSASGRLTIDGEATRDCVQAREPSPWNAAALRGVSFRAVGNEPGWWVEVAPGEAPRVRAVLDYGERELSLDMGSNAGGFVGEWTGEPVRLAIERTACVDGMSGQRFEARAELQVGTRRYAGCGGWLAD